MRLLRSRKLEGSGIFRCRVTAVRNRERTVTFGSMGGIFRQNLAKFSREKSTQFSIEPRLDKTNSVRTFRLRERITALNLNDVDSLFDIRALPCS